MSDLRSDCTAKCWTPVKCAICHRHKPPTGRSVAAEMANGMCNPDCDGFYSEPLPGHLWPNEAPPTPSATDREGEK